MAPVYRTEYRIENPRFVVHDYYDGRHTLMIEGTQGGGRVTQEFIGSFRAWIAEHQYPCYVCGQRVSFIEEAHAIAFKLRWG